MLPPLLLEPTVHVGKTIALAGVRAQIYKMVMRGRQAAAGVLTEQTKLRFRSRSASFVLLIQVSTEMGEFDTVRATSALGMGRSSVRTSRRASPPCAVHLTCTLVVVAPHCRMARCFTRR